MDVHGARGRGQDGDIDAGELPAARYKHVAMGLDWSAPQHRVIIFSGEAYRRVMCKCVRARARASEREEVAIIQAVATWHKLVDHCFLDQAHDYHNDVWALHLPHVACESPSHKKEH